MKDCPSTRALIAAPDGNGYVEDDLVPAANVVADSEDDEGEGEAIDSVAATVNLSSLLV